MCILNINSFRILLTLYKPLTVWWTYNIVCVGPLLLLGNHTDPIVHLQQAWPSSYPNLEPWPQLTGPGKHLISGWAVRVSLQVAF